MLDSAIHVRQTEAFINENPAKAIVARRTKVPSTSGGFTWSEPVPLPSQSIRIIELVRGQFSTPRMTTAGTLVTATHIAIAHPDADFINHDLFTSEGLDWEVVWVSMSPPWRKALELVGHGW
jgi:hypothetical protein